MELQNFEAVDVMRLFSIVIIILTMNVAHGGSVSLSKPNCPEKCGEVVIPYPFGVGSQCSYNSSFTVTCLQNDTINPPKPYMSSLGNLELVEVSLKDKRVRVMQVVTPLNCSSEKKRMPLNGKSLVGTPFIIASSLAVVGCTTEVRLMDLDTNLPSLGCGPVCGSTTFGCYGINCCTISTMATGPLQELVISYITYEEDNDGGRVCGFTFLADPIWFENGHYKNYYYDFQNQSNLLGMSLQYVPMSLQWDFLDIPTLAGEGTTCNTLTYPYLVTLDNNITNKINTSLCYCNIGFEGNPYMPGGGCKDIDECHDPKLRNCAVGTTCVNTVGSFVCLKDVKSNHMKSMIMGISSGAGALLMLMGAWMSPKVIRKMIKVSRKKKFFKRNGGFILQQQLSSNGDDAEKIKIFSSKELEQATDRYNDNRILGRGGQGTVYKGMLPDGRIVAVKKSKKMDADIKSFINEVVILSHINHRNVVKLLGCCLETEVPLLVYEFVQNGTLFQHIHDRQNDEYFPLSWKMRVRIASEVAEALSYLHNAASVPIYHRDIKSSNILLDDKYRAKVSDFGISRSISIGQTHLTTEVLGTFGYLDPEYFQSSQFTEKSDVYSFGVVMIELLTGKKAISEVRVEIERCLTTHFLQYHEEEAGLFNILDPEILKEGRMKEIINVAKLVGRCLSLIGKKRPTMKEVAAELVRIQTMEDDSTSSYNLEDIEFDAIEIYKSYDFSSTVDSIDLNVITVV